MSYSDFFNKYPLINYDINHTKPSKNLETVTNIFFRIGFIRDVISNTSSYYTVELEEGDTPELLANKVYGDSGAGWMILLANQITDPQFDWPLDSVALDAYIASKYGSIQNANDTIHHYEKVIVRTLEPGKENIVNTYRYWVNQTQLTEDDLAVPYEYYEGAGAGALEFTQKFATYSISGKTVTEQTYGEAINCYDYEVSLNDAKKFIKIIKAEYYPQIQREFDQLTSFAPSYLRTIA